jgi:hypothetical protein
LFVRRWTALLFAAALATPGVTLAPSKAADIATGSPPAVTIDDAQAATEAYLRRRAVLLMIRSTFDVIAGEEVPAILVADLEALGTDGPSDAELAILDRDLLAEGSYYIVALRYLIGFGGAAWPGDRPETSYVNDALVRLDALQDNLVAAIAQRADPLPLLLAVEQIRGLTEGFEQLPADMKRFEGRDELVRNVIAENGPWASS